MKFNVRKYYSGYCSYEVEAKNENQAYVATKKLPINYEEILRTLEDWEDCNEVEPIENN